VIKRRTVASRLLVIQGAVSSELLNELQTWIVTPDVRNHCPKTRGPAITTMHVYEASTAEIDKGASEVSLSLSLSLSLWAPQG
jgi:hypothetical protein